MFVALACFPLLVLKNVYILSRERQYKERVPTFKIYFGEYNICFRLTILTA
jgi:hypothetical protein